MSQTAELLRQMRATITEGWTQGCSARNRQGNPVVPSSPEASQWCLIGSITAGCTEQHTLGSNLTLRQNIYQIMVKMLENRNESEWLDRYNDNPLRTQAEVLELLDEAITVAETGGYK